MKKTRKILFTAALTIFGLFGLLQATTAAAQGDYTLGAQVCMPMNLPLASTLQWRSEGLLNNNTVSQWVVCPLANNTWTDNIDILARVRNRSDEVAEVQCLWKLTSAVGNTVRSLSVKQNIIPGVTFALSISNIKLDPGISVTVSCNLPPQFQLISFSIENA